MKPLQGPCAQLGQLAAATKGAGSDRGDRNTHAIFMRIDLPD